MTKARTRSQKLAAKRGRPRLPSTDREPNGKPSRRLNSQDKQRTETERDAMNVAVQARIRQNELEDVRLKDGRLVTAGELATSSQLGYELGRLLFHKKITKAQFHAGEKFCTDMARYYALTGQRFPSARAQDLFAVKGEGGSDDEWRATKARNASWRARRLLGALSAVGDIDTGRKVRAVVTTVCVGDNPLGNSTERNFLLRRGLNALTAFYGLDS